MDQVRVLFSVGDLLTRKTVSQVIFVFTLTAFTLPSTHAIQCFECDSSKVSSAGKFISSLHTKHFIEFFLHWILGPELKCGPRSGIWLHPRVRGELISGCFSTLINIYLLSRPNIVLRWREYLKESWAPNASAALETGVTTASTLNVRETFRCVIMSSF